MFYCYFCGVFSIFVKYYFQVSFNLKALANEDTLLPTQMFPRLPARATGTQNQKQFVSATNVSQFARARKHEQQCFCSKVSSFASTFMVILPMVKITEYRDCAPVTFYFWTKYQYYTLPVQFFKPSGYLGVPLIKGQDWET